MRSFPLYGVRALHPSQYDVYSNSITLVVTAQTNQTNKQQKTKKRYPGCLAHAVTGMFYSVFVNKRQPQYTHNVYGVGANRGQLLYTRYILRVRTISRERLKNWGGGRETRRMRFRVRICRSMSTTNVCNACPVFQVRAMHELDRGQMVWGDWSEHSRAFVTDKQAYRPTKPARHIWILVHGMRGDVDDMQYMAGCIRSRWVLVLAVA